MCVCVLCLVGFLVGDPERFSGGDVSRQPDRDPVHGEQLRRVTHHGEGVHEGCDEDQGGRLPGRIMMMVLSCTWLCGSVGSFPLRLREESEAHTLPSDHMIMVGNCTPPLI